MKKSDFVAAVAKEAGLTRVDAEKVVNVTINIITGALKSGDKVTLAGFGTFEVRQRAARSGVSIRTGERIQIPASQRPVFTAGAVLREAVSTKKVAAGKKVAPKSTPKSKAVAAAAAKGGKAGKK